MQFDHRLLSCFHDRLHDRQWVSCFNVPVCFYHSDFPACFIILTSRLVLSFWLPGLYLSLWLPGLFYHSDFPACFIILTSRLVFIILTSRLVLSSDFPACFIILTSRLVLSFWLPVLFLLFWLPSLFLSFWLPSLFLSRLPSRVVLGPVSVDHGLVVVAVVVPVELVTSLCAASTPPLYCRVLFDQMILDKPGYWHVYKYVFIWMQNVSLFRPQRD